MTQQGKCCFEHQTLSWTGASPGPSLCSSQCPHELTSPRTGPSQDQVSVPHTISYRWYRAVGAWRSQKFLLYMRKPNTSYLPGPFSCWASNILLQQEFAQLACWYALCLLPGIHLLNFAMSSSLSWAREFQASLPCHSTEVYTNKCFSLLFELKEHSFQIFFFLMYI